MLNMPSVVIVAWNTVVGIAIFLVFAIIIDFLASKLEKHKKKRNLRPHITLSPPTQEAYMMFNQYKQKPRGYEPPEHFKHYSGYNDHIWTRNYKSQGDNDNPAVKRLVIISPVKCGSKSVYAHLCYWDGDMFLHINGEYADFAQGYCYWSYATQDDITRLLPETR